MGQSFGKVVTYTTPNDPGTGRGEDGDVWQTDAKDCGQQAPRVKSPVVKGEDQFVFQIAVSEVPVYLSTGDTRTAEDPVERRELETGLLKKGNNSEQSIPSSQLPRKVESRKYCHQQNRNRPAIDKLGCVEHKSNEKSNLLQPSDDET